MSFFESIMSPFLFIIEEAFLLGYYLTGSYGFAIVLLSLAISFLLLPIFIFIEKSKKKDDFVKGKMKPLLDEIKEVYKGQERYYYIKAINRQFNYNSLKSLIPILSLLIQIPFFIAAYQFLDNYEPLKGVAFLFIQDLSKPDGLFGIVNILPIVMTLINVLTAYYYTRKGNKTDLKQMLILAAAFLILLFNLPAGLVLYWTINNVFSFLRLFITNPEVFRNDQKTIKYNSYNFSNFKSRFIFLLPRLKIAFYILSLIAVLSQLNWACTYSFNDITFRIIASIAFSTFLVLVIGIFSSIHETVPLKNVSLKSNLLQLWETYKHSLFTFTGIIIIFQINWALKYSFDDFLLRIIFSFVLGIIITGLFIFISYVLYGLVNLPKFSFSTNLNKFGRPYIIIFLVLAIMSILLQLNWAISHTFNYAIIRFTFAIIGSYVFIVLIANWLDSLKYNSKFSIAYFKHLFKSNKKTLTIFWIILTASAFFSQIYWALNHSSNDIVPRLILSLIIGIFVPMLTFVLIFLFKVIKDQIIDAHISPKIFFSLLFLLIYFHLSSSFHYADFNNSLSTLSIIILIPLQIISLIYIFSLSTISLRFTTILLIIFQITNIAALSSNISFTFLNIPWLANNSNPSVIVLTGILIILTAIPVYIKAEKIKFLRFQNNNWLIYLFSILYLSGFMFLWNPLAIFSSDAANFVFSGISILKQNMNLFFISFVVLSAFYLIIPKRIKPIWLIIILTLTVISFINNTIFPLEMGSLQQSKFLHQDNLDFPIWKYLVEAVSFILIFFILKLIINNYRKQTLITLILLNTILVTHSLKLAIDSKAFFKTQEVSADLPSSIHFSKNKKNVVYIVSDMFHGWNMKRILKDNPELKNTLSGFVWYPNTLSISAITGSSMPPLLGGFENTIVKLNKDTEHTVSEKMTSITEQFYNKVKSQGYSFTSTELIYSTIDKNKFDTYLPRWHKDWDRWNAKLNIGLSVEIGYTLLWENAAFYSAPLFLKPKIYNKGKWLHEEENTNENTNSAKRYNLLRLLPYISTANDDESSFIYIHTMATHHPWDLIDDNGKLQKNVSPYKNNEWTIKTFAKWIEWMKDNGTYDNTKIIFVSDHGIHWRHFKGDIDNTIPIIENTKLNLPMSIVKGMYPILLVKDYNKTGQLKEDWRFMSNADAYYIALNKENVTTLEPSDKRVLPFTLVTWRRKLGNYKVLPIQYSLRATNDAYDMNMWEKIE